MRRSWRSVRRPGWESAKPPISVKTRDGAAQNGMSSSSSSTTLGRAGARPPPPPRWAGPLLGARSRGAGTVIVVRIVAPATAATFAAAAEQDQLAAKAREHHLGRVALLPALIGPFAGLQAALEVNGAALAEVFLSHLGEILVEDHHPVPLRALLALAAAAVAPALRGGDVEVDDLLVVLGVAHLGIAPEISHQDDFVHAAGHEGLRDDEMVLAPI